MKFENQNLLLALVFGLLLFLVIVTMSGCNTVHGVLSDTGWLLQTGADNIHTTE